MDGPSPWESNNGSAESIAQRGGGGQAAAFAAILEMQANNGAEKTGNIQCDANNDTLIHWDSQDDAYRFAVTGTHLYRKPIDGGLASSAPDSEAEGVRLSTNLAHADACENFSRSAFTIIARTMLIAQGVGSRRLFEVWTGGPHINYITGGDDEMNFGFPGDPLTLVIPLVPEDQMVTAVMRYDGSTGYGAVYDEDGLTLIGSDSGAITALNDTGDRLQFKTAAFHLKRFAYINEFVTGAKLTDLLERMLTDDPLPT